MTPAAPPPATRDSRLADASSRWNRILSVRPELQPAVELQQQLIGLVVDLTDAVEHGRLPRLSLPPKYLAAKLGRGVPALAGEPIPLPIPLLRPTLLRLCDELAGGGAGETAQHIREAIEENRMDAAALLTASLARDQNTIRTGATQRGLSADLVWLVAELAISPFVHVLQNALLPPGANDPVLVTALSAWNEGYCPACGSWPALAEIVEQHRILRCSFCAHAWEMKTFACAYCANEGDRFVTVAPDEAQMNRRIEACAECGGYMKTVDVEALSVFPLLAIADLETMDLDMTAMEKGYRRPPLRDFKRR